MAKTAPWQVDLKIEFSEFIRPAFADRHKYTKIRAWRQTGKTYWAVQWICYCCLRYPNSKALWVDTVQLNISKYIERYFKKILGPLWDTVEWNQQKNIITFANWSVIDFGSAERPENLEWFWYDFVVLNEAWIILKKEWLWEKTIQPMCKNAWVKIIGTPKGKTDHKFAEMTEWAKVDDEWAEYHYSCYDSPYWTPEQLDRIRDQVPGYVWQQEYLADHVDLYENSMLSFEHLRFYDSDELDMTQFKKVYMHADTTHTGNTSSDYFCCGVVGEGYDRNYYVLDFILEKMDEATQARASILLYQKWQGKVQKFTYDEKAHQWFGYWIKKLAKEEYHISLPIEELNYPNDKISHFTPHIPHFKANRVWLPKNHPRMQKAQDQLLAFPTKEVNDDFIDFLSGCLDNFHVWDRLYFDQDMVLMQQTRAPILEKQGWSTYWRRVESHKYVIGCTIRDNVASITVIDCTSKEIIAEYYSQGVTPDQVAKELSERGYIYNTAFIAVNADNIGSAVVWILKEKKYPNLYQDVNEKWYDDEEKDILGMKMNASLKGILMANLALALKHIALFIVSHKIKEDLIRYPRELAEKLDDEYIRLTSLAITYDMIKKSGLANKITIS